MLFRSAKEKIDPRGLSDDNLMKKFKTNLSKKLPENLKPLIKDVKNYSFKSLDGKEFNIPKEKLPMIDSDYNGILVNFSGKYTLIATSSNSPLLLGDKVKYLILDN